MHDCDGGDDDDDDDGDDDIMLSTWLNRGSVVFNLGISIDRVLHDCCHSQLLGTGKTANGSAIIFLAERGFWGEFSSQGTYADVLADVLRKAHQHFLRWKRLHRLQASQPRFTPARLARKTRTSYPVLASKAIPSKVVTFWIAECALDHASKPEATDLDRLVATCMHAYASSLKTMAAAGAIMTRDEAEQYYDQCMLHLQTYAALHKLSREVVSGKNVNRTSWLLLCKHHHFYHHAKTTRQERINPGVSQLLAAEDWVGKLGRIARATHKSNVSLRTLERYSALIYLELMKLKRWFRFWAAEHEPHTAPTAFDGKQLLPGISRDPYEDNKS